MIVNFENKLAERFNAGDEQAFADIYKRYHRQLLFFAAKFFVGEAEAEELVSETFVKLHRGRAAGKVFESLEHIKNFLYKVTRNAAVTQIGSLQRQSVHMEKYLNDAGEQQADDEARNHRIETEMLQIIYDAVESLPAECKRIFKMLYLEERKYQDIAQELGLSPQTVRNQKSRAIQLIRSRILKRPALAAVGLSVAVQALTCFIIVLMAHFR